MERSTDDRFTTTDRRGDLDQEGANQGDVTVPIVTATGDGKGWRFGGPLAMLARLLTGR